MRRSPSVLLFALALAAVPCIAVGQASRVTTPREEFGHGLGAGYFLANYRQLAA